jgi:hypothetical protein
LLLRLLLLNLLPPCEDPRESLNSSKYGVYMSSKYGEKRTACVQYVFSIYARTCARPRAARPAGLPAPGPRSVRRPAWPPAGPAAVCLRGSRGHGSATPGHRASALPRGTSHGRDLPSHTLRRFTYSCPRPAARPSCAARARENRRLRSSAAPAVPSRPRPGPELPSIVVPRRGPAANHRCAPLTGRGRTQAAGRA